MLTRQFLLIKGLLHLIDNHSGLSALEVVLLIVGIIIIVIGAVFVFLWISPGNQKTETLDFQDFSAVDAGSAFQVSITQSSTYSVRITAGDHVYDRIKVTQEGETLKISVEPGVFFGVFNAKAEIAMPALNSIELSGASKGTVEGFSGTNPFAAMVSGASSFEFSNFVVGDVVFDVSGASHVSGQGTGSNLTLTVSGASNLDLTSFQVNDADVNLSGASYATVYPTGRLDVDASGASSLQYLGEPTLGNVNTSGGSNVNKK